MSTKKTASKSLKVIANPEKKTHEKWEADQDWIDFPRPFRWSILGAVSCGKTSLVLNYLVKSKPYDNIFILHPQTYNPSVPVQDEARNNDILVQNVSIPEYEGVEYTGLAYIPSMTYFDDIAHKRNLLIIDDIDICSYLKKRSDIREERVNKLFSYVSSHKNMSIIVTTQDASSQLPPFVFKMSNVVTVYHVKCTFVRGTLARKLAVPYKRMNQLLDMCKTRHDSITFDYTDHSPAELRLNIYTPITESSE